nr:hypothetical protein [Luteibacter rhizovicinus]
MTTHERVFECECKVMIRGIVFVALILALAMARGEVRRTDDWLHVLGTFSVALGFVSVLVLPALAITQDIVLTPDGMARSLFGFRSGRVSWDEITSVRCKDVDYKGAVVRHYKLFTGEGDKLPRLTFRSDYDDVEDIIAVVRVEVAKRAIPVLVRKMGWVIPADHVPLPGDDPRSMW